ncbi:MAG TPA: glycosyltransferase [Rhizomicrobium sp.]|nr:glycosyltransferase [Rhizomicrobium sp.]
MPAAGGMLMSGGYRGVLKVAGSQIRGWLMDPARPDRRIKFSLVIDGHLRGTYAANRPRRFLLGRGEPGENTHGFSIAIRKPWVNGELQSICIEDPDNPNLKISLMARLGPSANTLFDEHVVSGQLSIGQEEPRARARPSRIADDDSDREARPPANKALLRQIGALPDSELANLLLAIDRDIVVDRLNRHEKSGDWDSAFVFRRAFTSSAAEQRLLAFGRGAMKAHNHALAVRVTGAAAALHPQSFEANYLAGAAWSLHGEFDQAMHYLRAADRVEEGTVRAKREMVIVLARQIRGEIGPERRLELRNERLSLLRGLSMSDDAQIRLRYRVPYAEALFVAGRHDEAIAAADAILLDAPNDVRAMMIRARALVARNQIGDAVSAYMQILDIEPGHRGARMNLRLLAALTDDESTPQTGAASSVAGMHLFELPRGAGGDVSPSSALAASLEEIPQNWICTTAGYSDAATPPEIQSLLDANAARRTGHAEIRLSDGRRLEFWRRDALLCLAESGLLNGLDDSVSLARWRPFYGARESAMTNSRAGRSKRGVAVLISRNGADRYGGGEHFLENAAEHHARQGFEPVIVGTREDLRGEERIVAGRRCVFLGEGIAELRKFLLENEVSLVHAISGVGFPVANALNYTNIPFLYGVHFWNELLGDPEQTGYFDDVTGESRFRREFPLILSRATAIYANSQFTQKIIEDGFGVRCPVVFAVPREVA